MQIVILDQDSIQRPDECFDYSKMQQLGELIIYQNSTPAQIVQRCQQATVIIVNKPKLTSEIIQQLSHTQLILKAGVGVDNIDLDTARQRGIRVCNYPAYNTELLAQWTFSFILACANSLQQYNKAFKQGLWQQSLYQFPIQELAGKCLGIIGFGNGGKRVAALAHAFNMEVLIHSNYPDSTLPYRFVDLNTLAKECDFISLQRQLSTAFIDMINTEFLSQMKPTAYLINTARAALINEQAITQALQENKIAGFASDVFWQEPTPADHPLFHLDNTLFTPHMAWGAFETRQRLLDKMADTITHYVHNQPFNALT